MNLFRSFRDSILAELDGMVSEGALPSDLDTDRVSVEPPRDPAHGDLSTNAAMVLSKAAGRKPRDIAEPLAERLARLDEVETAEVAGPGFVNLRLTAAYWRARLNELLEAGAAYGRSTIGDGEAVNVEYVSANPTGPLHAGHGRGAVVGDALAALLEAAGYQVVREYYINDAGAQVDALARSVHHRYREALGESASALPEGLYPGEYLMPVAAALVERDGDRWRNEDEEAWLGPIREFAIDAMMDLIRDDLRVAGIEHDVFTSERALVSAGKVEEILADLERRDLVYVGTLEPPKGKKPDDWEPRPQMLFRATEFGDEVDRPLRKSDESWTYFATDIAYHQDKFDRDFSSMIDVWGADHGGYVKRMQAAVQAASESKATLDVKICQMVNLTEHGKPIRMSKRAGTFVTLRDVIDKVGKDVLRFIMLTRRNDAQLDFDFAKVTEQSKDNPVFYVQYAHARICSVFRNVREALPDLATGDAALQAADLDRLSDPAELDLIAKLALWPAMVEGAALAHEPHRIAYYMYELASAFHTIWARGRDEPHMRFIDDAEPARTQARLALIRGIQIVIASGLGIFGVTPVEEMR